MLPLSASFPSLYTEQIEDAVYDAVTDLCGISAQTAESDVRALLYRAAWRNARDISRSEIKRAERDCAWCAERPTATSFAEIDEAELDDVIRRIYQILPDVEMKAIFSLKLSGERSTRGYAEALGLNVCQPNTQRRLVKREKDRLDKFLRRSHAVREIAGRVFQAADDAD